MFGDSNVEAIAPIFLEIIWIVDSFAEQKPWTLFEHGKILTPLSTSPLKPLIQMVCDRYLGF